jgi:hypothetical protein
MIKFASLEETRARCGEPEPENYRLAYDGDVATNDLDEIWDAFNVKLPPGFDGHSLSMSDVVELYDHNGSAFHFVDRFGFAQIAFGGEEPIQTQDFGMNLSM